MIITVNETLWNPCFFLLFFSFFWHSTSMTLFSLNHLLPFVSNLHSVHLSHKCYAHTEADAHADADAHTHTHTRTHCCLSGKLAAASSISNHNSLTPVQSFAYKCIHITFQRVEKRKCVGTANYQRPFITASVAVRERD